MENILGTTWAHPNNKDILYKYISYSTYFSSYIMYCNNSFIRWMKLDEIKELNNVTRTPERYLNICKK